MQLVWQIWPFRARLRRAPKSLTEGVLSSPEVGTCWLIQDQLWVDPLSQETENGGPGAPNISAWVWELDMG